MKQVDQNVQIELLQNLNKSFDDLAGLVPPRHRQEVEKIRRRTQIAFLQGCGLAPDEGTNAVKHNEPQVLASYIFSELLWAVFKDMAELNSNPQEQLTRVLIHYKSFICLLDEFEGGIIRVPKDMQAFVGQWAVEAQRVCGK